MKMRGWGVFVLPDGNEAATRDSRATRLVAWLTRGEVPVDGFALADENLAPGIASQRERLEESLREAEDAGLIPQAPVRWGGFR